MLAYQNCLLCPKQCQHIVLVSRGGASVTTAVCGRGSIKLRMRNRVPASIRCTSTPIKPTIQCRVMDSSNENGDREAELEPSCTPEDVFSALIDAKLSCSTRVFGSQLGLDPPDLDAIIHNPLDQPPKLLQILNKCSERAMCGLTWARISDVLKKPALREYRVTNQIEHQYLRRQSSLSSSLTLSPLSSSTSSTDCVWPFPTHEHMEIG